MKSFDALKKIMVEAEGEVLKVDKGNKSAGTRLRVLMQEVRGSACDVRQEVMALREKE